MGDDDSTCVYCGCHIEWHSKDVGGCELCDCNHVVFWDDDRGDE